TFAIRPPAAPEAATRLRGAHLGAFVVVTVAAALKVRWYGDGFPRYFGPALALLQIWMLMQWGALVEAPPVGARRIATALLVPVAVLVLVQSRHFPRPSARSITSIFGHPIPPREPDATRPGCVARVSIEAMNWQQGSWALAAYHGLDADAR